jgi:hypothetical protein
MRMPEKWPPKWPSEGHFSKMKNEMVRNENLFKVNNL